MTEQHRTDRTDAEGATTDGGDATQAVPAPTGRFPTDPSTPDTQGLGAGDPQETRPLDVGAGEDTRVVDAGAGQDTQVLPGGGVPPTRPLAGRPHRESVMPADRGYGAAPWAHRSAPAERSAPAAGPPSGPTAPRSAAPAGAAPAGPSSPAPAQHPAPWPGTAAPQRGPAAPQRPAPPAPAQRAQTGGTGGRRGTEPTAVASLVTGLLGIVVPLVGVLAIVLGGIGLDRTRRRGTNGRGMARTGLTLGSLQVLFTTLLVVGGLMFWNAYGEDIEAGLAQVDAIAEGQMSVPDVVLGGLTGDYSFDDLQELGGLVGDADELQELGGQCRAGEAAACEDLLDRVPDDLLQSFGGP
ncbi:DUF4190 domain-containing protein [Isoptericola sp. AK164]|uniref:DUF4190 domain-containing protein n=1 Tax=Isoptericola sp. AK164 TaxID=3024246 RepID=UPI00241859A1|nr:DUF4190 domain-containing protein [Isoptericola sp. AK164]